MVQRRNIAMTPGYALVLLLLGAAMTVGWVPQPVAQTRVAGEVVIAWPVTLAAAWFDPAETPPQITPFGLLYALQDALVRPMPGEKMGHSLAESWSESPDGLMYEFKLGHGLRLHNGDPCTTEDVKFNFERYKGTEA